MHVADFEIQDLRVGVVMFPRDWTNKKTTYTVKNAAWTTIWTMTSVLFIYLSIHVLHKVAAEHIDSGFGWELLMESVLHTLIEASDFINITFKQTLPKTWKIKSMCWAWETWTTWDSGLFLKNRISVFKKSGIARWGIASLSYMYMFNNLFFIFKSSKYTIRTTPPCNRKQFWSQRLRSYGIELG